MQGAKHSVEVNLQIPAVVELFCRAQGAPFGYWRRERLVFDQGGGEMQQLRAHFTDKTRSQTITLVRCRSAYEDE